MKKILIIDDSAFFRSLLREDLLKYVASLQGKDDVVIHEADGTFAALEKAKTENPDLVFLDVVMRDSEQEGVEILQKLKSLYPNLNIVMLTSVGQIAIMKRCQDLGAKDYLTKPFDSQHLMAIVKKYLV
jgi:two-component system, chemotaxis family, chemotaxis protein CheY